MVVVSAELCCVQRTSARPISIRVPRQTNEMFITCTVVKHEAHDAGEQELYHKKWIRPLVELEGLLQVSQDPCEDNGWHEHHQRVVEHQSVGAEVRPRELLLDENAVRCRQRICDHDECIALEVEGQIVGGGQESSANHRVHAHLHSCRWSDLEHVELQEHRHEDREPPERREHRKA